MNKKLTPKASSNIKYHDKPVVNKPAAAPVGKPMPGAMGWSYHADKAGDAIHFTHGAHGTVSIKANPVAGKDRFVAMHNGKTVGKYPSTDHAVSGARNYIQSLKNNPTKFQIEDRKPAAPSPKLRTLTQRNFNQPAKLSIVKSEKPSLRSLKSRMPPAASAVNPIDAFSSKIQNHWESHFGGGLVKDDMNPAPKAPSAPKAPEMEAAPSTLETAEKAPKTLAQLKPKVRSYSLLTDEAANTKTSKNARSEKYQSAILHLAPSDLSGIINTCPGASEGCRQACLNSAGRGGLVTEAKPLNTVQQARVRRTTELAKNPDVFFTHLDKDIKKIMKISQKEGKHPVVRLNGTSDLDWQKFRPKMWGGKNVFEMFPNVQFYDYTKMPGHVLKNQHANYHLTFSRSEKNESLAQNMLAKGHNVAVVFGGKQLPKTYLGRPVISGDNDDLRFLDPKDATGGYVIGLRAKGDAEADTTGFVVWGHEGDPLAKPKTKSMKSKIIHGALNVSRDKKP